MAIFPPWQLSHRIEFIKYLNIHCILVLFQVLFFPLLNVLFFQGRGEREVIFLLFFHQTKQLSFIHHISSVSIFTISFIYLFIIYFFAPTVILSRPSHDISFSISFFIKHFMKRPLPFNIRAPTFFSFFSRFSSRLFFGGRLTIYLGSQLLPLSLFLVCLFLCIFLDPCGSVFSVYELTNILSFRCQSSSLSPFFFFFAQVQYFFFRHGSNFYTATLTTASFTLVVFFFR